MSIKLIQTHEDSAPVIKDGEAYLYITNPTAETRVATPKMELSLTLRVNNFADAFNAVTDWLCHLSFSQKPLTLVIFSDCEAVSATDVAFMATLILAKTPVESSSGKEVSRFKIRGESAFEDCIVSSSQMSKSFLGAQHV
jgi:hypothetical protein